MKDKNTAVKETDEQDTTGEATEGATGGESEETAAPVAAAAPTDLLAQLEAQGFTIKDLTPKDQTKIRQLEELNRRFEMGSAQVMRGLLALLNEDSNITNMKNQLALTFKEKYEIPDGAQWQAEGTTGKIYYKMPDTVTPPAGV